jgi:hypothetical protein
MRGAFLFVIGCVCSPFVCYAEEINLSNCNADVKRLLILNRETVAMVRTYDGPAVAILLTDLAADHLTYVWRYREDSGKAATTGGAVFDIEKARREKAGNAVSMTAGNLVLEWNLNPQLVNTLQYCATRAGVEYYPRAEFQKLP